MDRPAAKHIILDLLSTMPGRAMPVRALVATGALFDLAENPMRVALARLLASGQVERDERGLYRLAPRAQAVAEQVGGWRRLDARRRTWSGGWIGVHTAGLPRGRSRRTRGRQRALRLLGFRALAPGLEVRPDNLAGGCEQVRRELHGLGLESEAPVFVLRDLDPATEARARALWPVTALAADYRRMRAAIEESLGRLASLPPPQAMTESFLLGGRAIRLLATDPLLPDAIVPDGERDQLVDAMRRYDRAGRAAWGEFLRGFGVTRGQAPADLRLDPDVPRAAGGSR